MTAGSAHWDGIYAATSSTTLSWYTQANVSLRLIEEIASNPSAAVIDVGAGASRLVDGLIANGFRDVTILDVAREALAQVRQRLGDRAGLVTFVQHDVLAWRPDRFYDVWHDRAVFHFLTDETARDRYVEIAAHAVRAGGGLVIATFAEDGPARCSGLPVARYSAASIGERFSEFFSIVTHEREVHKTPSGVSQPFTWVSLRRNGTVPR